MRGRQKRSMGAPTPPQLGASDRDTLLRPFGDGLGATQKQTIVPPTRGPEASRRTWPKFRQSICYFQQRFPPASHSQRHRKTPSPPFPTQERRRQPPHSPHIAWFNSNTRIRNPTMPTYPHPRRLPHTSHRRHQPLLTNPRAHPQTTLPRLAQPHQSATTSPIPSHPSHPVSSWPLGCAQPSSTPPGPSTTRLVEQLVGHEKLPRNGQLEKLSSGRVESGRVESG